MKTNLKVEGEKVSGRDAALRCPRTRSACGTEGTRGIYRAEGCAAERGADGASAPSLPRALRPAEHGIALVITLIMLSIITFMAITFLILSQRERGSTTTATDQKQALMAADTALNRSIAELTARMLVQTNYQNMPFLVSTSYVNYNGFTPGLTPPIPTDVNYDYLVNGQPFANPNQRNENIASLLYNPRVPVFVTTNPNAGPLDFRFYVDLNRNGRFDTNGVWPALSGVPGTPYVNATNNQPTVAGVGIPLLTNNFVGDPEWIGILERPQEMHSLDNRFVSRYAYMIIPVGKTLDINYIHNRAKRLTQTGEGFLRNQGVGTFEGNLAGFLADLNTNIWWSSNWGVSGVSEYNYNTATPFRSSTGSAFTDANSLLQYRYGNSPIGYQTLNSASQLFPNAAAIFATDNIDQYSDGPLMLGTSTNQSLAPDNRFLAWSGADNTNHFFTSQDPFDPTKTGNFGANLMVVGSSNDSYNAYTYYRMLSQLGADSSPERNKMNINYKNTDNSGNIVPGMETNLIPWTPVDFFTNAADRMFRQLGMTDLNGNLITVTNIPFCEDPTIFNGTNINYYTPAVHRILQLAANMYDATTSRFLGAGPTNYPSVFRPVFRSLNGVGSIVGYEEVSNTLPLTTYPFLEMTNFIKTSPQLLNDTANIYGIPWVIGVKKGFPTFNTMQMANEIGVQRELQFTNYRASTHTWDTNQLFDFHITNVLGVDAWNSYSNRYGRPLKMEILNQLTMTITNQAGKYLLQVINFPFGATNIFPGGWTPGQTGPQIDMFTNYLFANGTYVPGAIVPLFPVTWFATQLPQMTMSFNFKFQYVLIDTSVDRIIDFVNLVGPQPQAMAQMLDPMDISAELATNANETGVVFAGGQKSADIWATNFAPGGVLMGVMDQLEAAAGNSTSESQPLFNNLNKDLSSGQPFSIISEPTFIVQQFSWEANDPLVHYMAQDLTAQAKTQNQVSIDRPKVPVGTFSPTNMLPDVGKTNIVYAPWGAGNPNNQNPIFDTNPQAKDPWLTSADGWDFPTNKFWDIGILGRIHRGTPWQTVNLKPFNPDKTVNPVATNWAAKWGNDNVIYQNGTNPPVVDSDFTLPNKDFLLFDLFTSTPNENSAHGQLNVNQSGLAAWSAILSGVNVISNGLTGPVPITISPAGVYNTNNPTQVAAIWLGISNSRTNTNITNGPIFLNGAFQHAGDILNTPQLTVASPFLDPNGLNPQAVKNGLAAPVTDEELERIPQQVMSLLTLNPTPRFVIYSYGQTLHPADHSLVVGGTFNGLCTNYQVTAEIATRAVVRVDGSPDPQYVNGKVDSQGRSYPPHIVVEEFNVLPPD